MSDRLKRRLAKAVPWTVFDGVFNAVYAAGMVVLLARCVSPAELGAAAAALAVAQITEAAYAGGLQDATVSARSGHTGLTDTAHVLTLALSLAGMAVCLAGGLILGRMLDSDAVFGLTAAASLTLPLNGLGSIPVAILTRKMRTPALTRRLLAAKLSAAASLAVGGMLHLGPWSVVLSSLASSLGALASIAAILPRWPRLRLHRAEVGPLLRFGAVSSADNFCFVATSRLFTVAFGSFHGMAQLGNFQFAFRLVDEMTSLLQTTALRLGLSYFAGLERSKGDMGAAFVAGTRLLSALGMPAMAGLAVLAPTLVPALFGPHWSDAVPYIVVLAVTAVLFFPRALVPSALRARGRPDVLVHLGLLTAALSLSAVLVTARLPPLAAALGWAAAQLAAAPLALGMVRRQVGVPVARQAAPLAPLLLATLGMAAAVWMAGTALAGAPAILRLGGAVSCGVLAYGGLLLVLDPAMLRDTAGLARHLRRRETVP